MTNIKTIKDFSFPKINLALDILGISNDYHEIKTVFFQLQEPRDEIVITADKIVCVDSDEKKLSSDMKNTALKAAFLLKKTFKVEKGAKIFIQKNIPLMSGLGGGSSNAVCVLKMLSKLWGIKCCDGSHASADCSLRRIADQIGMDCAFFFHGGTAIGEHYGEKITVLPSLPADIKVEILETGVEMSSFEAYKMADMSLCGLETNKTEELIKAIKSGNSNEIIENSHNDFEKFIFKRNKKLANIKTKFEKKGCKILLCGSGGALMRISHNPAAL